MYSLSAAKTGDVLKNDRIAKRNKDMNCMEKSPLKDVPGKMLQ
tara:strand:+ start:97 stop:225 length:129 start_codon:yes stop_codon:yes gene_type:complete